MLPTTDDSAPRLTGSQFQFVQNFLVHTRGDGVAALRMMGVSQDVKVLQRLASRYLNHPAVQWHLQRHATQHVAPTEVLALFAAHARGNQGDFWEIDANGQPHLNLTFAKEHGLTRLIKKLALGKDGQVSLELYDAQAAARDLAKILGMYRQESNVNVVVEHVLRGLSTEVREEVLTALGGLVAGALPSGEDAYDVVDADVLEESEDNADVDEAISG